VSETARSSELRFDRRQRQVIAVVLVGIVSTTFPVTVMSVSLPTIAKDMHISQGAVPWVVTAPLLAQAIATPILGRLGDLRGHRRVFIVGFAAATAIAFLTSFAWNGSSLIALRTLSAFCGAATAPSGMALMIASVSREQRLKVISVWSMVSAMSPSLGLAVGGPLIDGVGWRAVFIVQAVPSLACLLFALKLVPTTPRQPNVAFDVPGAATLGAAVFGVLFGVNRGAEWGWTNPIVLLSLIGAPVMLAAFVLIERASTSPLLPLTMLKHRDVSSTLAAQIFLMAPFQGAAIVAPFLMRNSMGLDGWDITYSGLFRVVTFGLLGGVAGRVVRRIDAPRSAALGCALAVGGMLVLAQSAHTTSYVLIMVGMAFVGGGAGFARTPFATSLTNAVKESQIGVATAAMNLTTQLGSSLGITAMNAVLSSSKGGGTQPYFVSFIFGAGVCVLSIPFALRLRPTRQAEVEAVPAIATAR
jgi:MFS family permease